MARKTKEMVLLEMPQETWDFLKETLQMDAQSPAFDIDLRKQIARELGKITERKGTKSP